MTSRHAPPLRALVVLLLVGTLAGCASAQPQTSSREGSAVQRGKSLAAALRDSLDLPGLAVAVMVGDEMVLSEGVGWGDLEQQVPITPESRFRIGSVSKLLTATAAAQLVQAGELDLDAPISRYVPGLPPHLATVTARQLAGHLGGIRHYRRDEFISQERFTGVSESFGRFLVDSLVNEPGAAYSYSSYGYNLLGAVLEGAAEEEFRTLVRDEVLRPLGMEATSAEDASAPAPHVGFYWRNREGEVVEVPPADLSDRWPSGGYVSTAPDLARFGAGVTRDGYLSENVRTLLFTTQRTTGGGEAPVGIGWRVATDSAGRRYVHHGGEALGSRAFLLVYPEERVVVALATNLSFAPIGEEQALELANLFVE